MSGNPFAVLAKLGDKKKSVVVDTTTSAKPVKEKKEKAPKTEKKETKAAAAPKTATKTAAAAPAKKGEALGAKVGGPSSLAKVAAANSVQATKDAAFDQKKAENQAKAEERKKQRESEKEAAVAEAKANAKPESEMTEEEKEAAAKQAAFEAKKQKEKEAEDETPKVSMKEYQREQNAKRFQLDAKNARHVDPTATKGKNELKRDDNEGIKVAKEAPKPKTANTKGKNNAPAAKTAAPQKKEKKAEAVNFMALAAQNNNFGPRRREGGSAPRSGPRRNENKGDAAEQAVPQDAAFPDLE